MKEKLVRNLKTAYYGSLRVLGGVGYMGMIWGGEDIYNGRPVAGISKIVGGAIFVAMDTVIDIGMANSLRDDDRNAGRKEIVDKLGIASRDRRKPLYTSLDGGTAIYQPQMLIASFNDEPGSIPQQVVRTLAHSRGRDLEIQEVEKLRRAEALLGLFPGVEKSLDDRNRPYVEELGWVVSMAEAKYRKTSGKE